MKTLQAVLTLLVIVVSATLGQGQVYNGNLNIFSQAQADAFSYKVVNGNLQISGNITNLDGFDSLESVIGTLNFYSNQATEITGFNNLSYVGSLEIWYCNSLVSITGFQSLDTVMNSLKIQFNPNLKAITGFHDLKKIGGHFFIISNGKLETIDSLNSLSQVGKPNQTQAYVRSFKIDGDSLTYISGFTSLSTINSHFSITSQSPYLKELDLLKKVTAIDGKMYLIGLPGIKDLHDLDSLKTADDIKISLDSLKVFSGLPALKKCGRLTISNNPMLESIDAGLDSLEFVGGTTYSGNTAGVVIDISSNPLLKTFDCFHRLKTIDGSLIFGSNDSLQQLTGFENLEVIKKNLYIYASPTLEEFTKFPKLDSLGGLLIFRGSGLKTIDGFQNVVHIGGQMQIIENTQLISVTGFGNLISQNQPSPGASRLYILDNPLLLNLCGFYNLFQTYPNPGSYNYYLYKWSSPGIAQAIGNGTCKLYDYPVTGSIFSDTNGNCLPDSTESGLIQWVVKAKGPTGTHYAITDSIGHYKFWLDTAAYTLKLFPPTSLVIMKPFISLCDTIKQMVVNTDSLLNIQPDWGATMPQCPYVVTSISNVILRRCFDRSITIEYENLGNAPANQSVLVFRKPDLLQILGSSAPFTYGVDSVLIFQIGTISPGGKGSITLQTKIPCTNIEHLGLEQCLEVWVETPSYCQPPTTNWSGASLESMSSCFMDSLLVMEIKNYGGSPMTDSTTYRLYSDTTLTQTGSIQLDTSNSFLLTIPVDNTTYRLEVDQVANHPFPGIIAAALEGCTDTLSYNTSRGLITAFPTPKSRTHPSYTSTCRPIEGSYDPNDKQVIPTGLGPQKLVEPGTELTYRIRFQNTGTDTAFTVRIEDRLDLYLDQTTFMVLSASHPYSVSFSGDSSTLVTFLFTNILLPDSNTNEPASNGYIEYSIMPKSGAVSGTSVSNVANIYFDYNPPIQTNKVKTNFGIYPFPTLLYPKNSLVSNQPPEAPGFLTITDSSQNYSILTWEDKAISELGFLVFRSVNDTTSFVILDSLSFNSLNYLDTIPPPGSTFYYKVAAYSLGGVSGFSNVDSVYTSYPIPPASTIQSVVDTVLFEVTFTWTDTTIFESGFIIQRSSDSLTFVSIDSVKASITSYTDSLPGFDQAFWYRVIAYNVLGNSGPSDTLQVFQATPVPTSPEIAFTDTTILFSPIIGWIAPNYFEKGFLIQRSTDASTFTTLDSLVVGTTSFQDSIPNVGVDYWYRVIAYNHNGNSPASDTVKIFQPIPAPTEPTNLSVDTSLLYAPSLTWVKPDYFEEGFIVERSTDGLAFSTRDTLLGQIYSYQDTLKAVYTPIYYQVRAFNQSGNSDPSNIVAITQAYPVPPTPSTLQATLYDNLTAELTWEDGSNFEFGFILEKQEANGSFAIVDTIDKNTTSYLDSQDLLETDYTYRVKAFNPAGASGYSNKVIVFHSLKIPPAPYNLTIVSQNEILPMLSWTDNSVYEDGYILERSFENQGYLAIQQLDVNQTMTIDSSLSTPGSYQYRVFAYNQLGNSGYSNVVNYLLTTSIDLQALAFEHFQILPNPFTDKILIRNTGSPAKGRWEIVNLLGESLAGNSTVFETESTIALPELPSGTYFLLIELKDGRKAWKLQKE